MPKLTVAKLAKALIEQHNFDWDAAYSAAYCYVHHCMTTTPWAVALFHIERVKNVPIITEKEVKEILNAYRKCKVGE